MSIFDHHEHLIRLIGDTRKQRIDEKEIQRRMRNIGVQVRTLLQKSETISDKAGEIEGKYEQANIAFSGWTTTPEGSQRKQKHQSFIAALVSLGESFQSLINETKNMFKEEKKDK